MRPGNVLYYLFVWLSGLIGIVLPLGIGIYLLVHGGRMLDFVFLFDRPRGSPLGSAGGILPALLGSLSLTAIGLVLAFPAGLGSAVYLSEFARSARLKSVVRLLVESLAGVPSIIYGMFGYAFFVVLLRLGTSLMAGSLVMAIVMYPIILITAQEAFDAVSREYREAALSLGVDRTEWITRVLLVKSLSRILAGVVLAVGHAMGSAAPILFTAAVFFSAGGIQLDHPVMTLPTHLYFLVSEAVSFDHAFGTALVLVLGLLCFNSAAMYLRGRVRD
ncbi:MAG: phosphate ABC transporter, permease protein PstA [Desulfobulbaceae bacterium A2]|nr:MAG: phosphate ABC transporter, permease protein PstA [Desulfobulbaceae bacterium A2]